MTDLWSVSQKKSLVAEAVRCINGDQGLLPVMKILEKSQNEQEKSCFFHLAEHRMKYVPHLFFPNSFQTVLAYATILNQLHINRLSSIFLFPKENQSYFTYPNGREEKRFHLDFYVFQENFKSQLIESNFDPYEAKKYTDMLDRSYLEKTIFMTDEKKIVFNDDSGENQFMFDLTTYKVAIKTPK